MFTETKKEEQNSAVLSPSRLKHSSVLVIGAGGLGCAIISALAGAGIGKIGICDFDKIGESNLNRQFLYKYEDIGKPKAEKAAEYVSAFAPEITVEIIPDAFCRGNAEALIIDYDFIMLAADNLEVRSAANEACVKMKKPFIDSGIAGLYGNIYFYSPGKTACLSCVFDGLPESGDRRTVCAVSEFAGSLAALMALRYLSDGCREDAGKIIMIDLCSLEISKLPVKKSAGCKICGGGKNG